MDLMFNISGLAQDKEEFSTSKKDVLKFLKIIGVDTRFISYTPQKIYINNLRFSKFSRKREATFKKHYPGIEIVRNSLFQKICSKSSKVLSFEINPNSVILMPKNNFMVEVLMEPYTRKYGVKLVYEGDYDYVINPTILDDEVNGIFSIIENENNDELATSFMEFLEDVAPQYRENVLKASEYIEKKLEAKK